MNIWRNIGLSASFNQTQDEVNIVCQKLGDVSTLFACQNRLGPRPRSPETLYGTYSLRESAILGIYA